MFTDRVKLQLRAGRGGNGVVAWRREKYIPKGGPCGGDGGNGGSIIVEADSQLLSLDSFRHRKILKAENGFQGGPNNRKGRNGVDLIIKVPCGTVIKLVETGEIICDLTEDQQRFKLFQGGKGGKGNTFFKSSINRTPTRATPGRDGESGEVEFELKLIADVGLVGLPNAGKSTLMASMTAASVKIGAYPFTTLVPNLGYINDSSHDRVLIADIPGLIKGAHQNKGLGLEFLRHIERTHLLLFVLDASSEDPHRDLSILFSELDAYNPRLREKPAAIVLNKIDLIENPDFKDILHGDVFTVSALEGSGVTELVGYLKRKLSKYTRPENNAMVAPAGQSNR